MATVITSIGSGASHNESVAIDSVSGSGPYTVTLTAAVPATVVVGDAFMDEAATPDKWLITGISGSDLTVEDSTGVGAAPDDSGTSGAEIVRYYSGSTPITDWESELDDTDLYASMDDAEGHCYNDDDFDETLTINGGGTVGLVSVTLTVAAGERHDGTAGTGAAWVRSTVGATYEISIVSDDASLLYVIEWLELDRQDARGRPLALNSNTATGDAHAKNLIVHNVERVVADGNSEVSLIHCAASLSRIQNCILYNCIQESTSTHNSRAIDGNTSVGRDTEAFNNTIYNVQNTNGTGDCLGIWIDEDDAQDIIQNNIVTEIGGDTSGTIACYEPTSYASATVSHNLSDDNTATGTGSLRNRAANDQFLNTASGFEDFHLKSGADAIDAGTDLGTTHGVNISMPITGYANGYDRDADPEGIATTWDIGAAEFLSAAGGSPVAILLRRRRSKPHILMAPNIA